MYEIARIRILLFIKNNLHDEFEDCCFSEMMIDDRASDQTFLKTSKFPG